MVSRLFQDSVDAQLIDALATAQREFNARLKNILDDELPAWTKLFGIESARSHFRSDISGIVMFEVFKRVEIIKESCVNALGYTRGTTPDEAVEFAQKRFLSEFSQIKTATSATMSKIPGGAQEPIDFSYDHDNSMRILAGAFSPQEAPPPEQSKAPTVFISHSSLDVELAMRLVKLLRAALPLRSEQIRCTSVDGYRPPAGADTDELLRAEVLGARLLIGIMSSSSLESAYVLFELGARWGAKKQLVPLLGPGMKAKDLRGPVAGLNALSCEHQSQLHQLVAEVAEFLGVSSEKPHVYQEQIEAIVSFATSTDYPSGSRPRP